ncbi:MAG: hypothetical protein HY698_14745 [Deltaproteobacteria bacterium]|nr:hypothetical protein [Deltaproteobacteria bacterium]
MRLKILFHDNCFDGAASAALMARFYRDRVRPDAEIEYLGLQHKAGDPFPPHALDADEHACVDFRYSQSPRLTWWFDHHVSAFSSPEDRAHFEADKSGKKFYDPSARSNTKFEAEILVSRFGFDATRYAELIHWADTIDGAQFPDARTAVELKEPALRLMTWVENNKDFGSTGRFIRDLQERPLCEIAESDYVAGPLKPLLERHRQHVEIIRKRARLDAGVVSFDLSDDGVEAHNKFIAYMLFPDTRYTVGITRAASRVKISVGSNPWAKAARTHNIAQICERYGGGGHPVVGAISLPPDQVERARQIAQEIASELRR